MVGRIQREYLSGTKLVTEKRSTWRDSGVNDVVDSVVGAVNARNDFFEREKNLVWKRLNLEAAQIQDEELNSIRTANSIDEIPGIVEKFQKSLKDKMSNQTWGPEWMRDLGSGFLAYNQRDVEKAVQAKEKELAEISLNNTLKAYADKIAAAPEDEAAFLSFDADKMIDADTYLTPTEKQSAKNNFAKLSIGGMVNTNPEGAKRALSDPGRFKNLTEIERKEYLQKADNLLIAREKDRIAAEDRAVRLAKNTADMNMYRAKYLFDAGKMSNEEVLKIVDNNYAASPEIAGKLRKAILSPKDKISDPEAVRLIEQKLEDKTATIDEIYDLENDDKLIPSDVDRLIKQGEKRGLWKDSKENKDAEYRARLSLIDEGRDAVNQAFANGDISKATRDALLKDIDAKEKNETAEQKKLKENKEKLDKAVKELEKQNQIDTYLDLRNQIDEAKNTGGLPGEKEINELVRNGALTEELASKLRTVLGKKEADFKPKKISEGEKMENLNSLQDEFAVLQLNPTGEGFAALADNLDRFQSLGALPKADATSFSQSFWADYEAFDSEQMNREGNTNLSWYESNNINNTIQNYLNEKFKIIEINEKKGTVAERAVKRAQNQKNSRYRVMQRNIYRSALVNMAKKHGLEDTSMKGINDSGQKEVISAEALEETKKLFAQQIYQNADVAAINPTNILSNENGLQRIVSGADDKGRGEKLVDERPVKIKKTSDGHYGVMFADGSVREINEEQYNSYMGQK